MLSYETTEPTADVVPPFGDSDRRIVQVPQEDLARQPFRLTTPDGTVAGSLLLPFPSGINPHAETVALRNQAWAVEVGLISESDTRLREALARCRFEQLTSLVHRETPLEGLELLANSYTAIFAYDDLVDNADSKLGGCRHLTAHAAQYLVAAAAGEKRPPLRPHLPGRDDVVAVGNAFADVACRLLRYTDRAGMEEYVQGMREYMQGCVLESERRAARVRSIADYAAVRLHCSAMFACLEAAAIVERFDIPSTIRNDPAFCRMRETTGLCVAYVNDIFSYAKESRAGELSNLVIVHRMLHDSSFGKALAAAIAINDGVVGRYLAARADLEARPDLDDGTLGYVELLESWMRGNFDWYNEQRTDRYVDCLTTMVPA